MKIQLIWAQIIDGLEREAGEIVEVAERVGRLLIGQGGAAMTPDSAKAAESSDPAPTKAVKPAKPTK